MKNRVFKISIISIVMILFYLLIIEGYSIGGCVFRNLLDIKCPACGLTRAFRLLINLDIINAIKFNFLAPIIFLFFLYLFICLIIDILFNKNLLEKIFIHIGKYYIYIIAVLIISMIINNIHPLV